MSSSPHPGATESSGNNSGKDAVVCVIESPSPTQCVDHSTQSAVQTPSGDGSTMKVVECESTGGPPESVYPSSQSKALPGQAPTLLTVGENNNDNTSTSADNKTTSVIKTKTTDNINNIPSSGIIDETNHNESNIVSNVLEEKLQKLRDTSTREMPPLIRELRRICDLPEQEEGGPYEYVIIGCFIVIFVVFSCISNGVLVDEFKKEQPESFNDFFWHMRSVGGIGSCFYATITR